MKRKICTLLLLGSCLFSISACGTKSASDDIGNVQNSSQPEEPLQNRDTEEPKDNTGNTAKKQTGFEELNEVVSTDVENTVSAIESEYEKLVTEIDTYEKYLENTDKVESFYKQVYEDTKNLCIRMREHSINYAEKIMASDKSNDDKYKDFEELYDCIYDDAGEDIYDEIYDGILDDIYDDFYNGILHDAYDNNISYDEWSNVCSNEYDWWSDTHSDVYDEWSDFRSDVYDFWSDMRSELWDDDIERAREKIIDFQEDIEKLKNKSIQSEDQTSDEEKGSNVVPEDTEKSSKTAPEDTENNDVNTNEESADDIRPEFKEAMDSYEAFYDEYCDVMKKYKENPTDTEILDDYLDMLEKGNEMSEKFAEWENGDMNDAELKYYLDVYNRVNKKLIDVLE